MNRNLEFNILDLRQKLQEELEGLTISPVIDFQKYKALAEDLAVCNYLLSKLRYGRARKHG